ncbi:MAG: hypothetical protein U1E76_03815 [Planctomycetota bacterium]
MSGPRLAQLAASVAIPMSFLGGVSPVLAQTRPNWFAESRAKLVLELGAKSAAAERPQIERGLDQAADFWRAEDGDASAFEEFARTHYASDPAVRDAMFARFEQLLEQLDGHMEEITREFRSQAELERGPILPFDEIFAGYSPAAHVTDDFFANKLAFVVLLNFPLTTLEQRLTDGEKWSRRQWAEARLARRFAKRIPAAVNQQIAQVAADGEAYIARYNIWMHHLVSDAAKRLFPPKLRLLSHWNLRDEIKAAYGDRSDGLAKQRTVAQVMARIVTQTIPETVIDNPRVDWNPFTNEVAPAAVQDLEDASAPPAGARTDNRPEPHTRYARLLESWRAESLADPYSPTAPTLIARRFDEDREIPEARVRAMLETVLTSPLVARTAALIEARLGRKLEPFDIWYDGFKDRGAITEAELDALVAKKYPSAEAYAADIPNLLGKLGFAPERARMVAANIVVDPARGSGHALGAQMRSAKVHLRTRVGKNGMDYKGYNIAVHEMGHNVEQTLSMNEIDHTLLEGVPNNAFTEALAFVFQGHDLELLGLARPSARSEALKTLNDFWGTYEISGVALVDMGVWHWMYDHRRATPAELEAATVALCKEIWNRYYAPVLGEKDAVLLGIYSHMISYSMYLPDYPLGHMIAFQIEEQMKQAGAIGPEFERMARCGSVAPDIWMKNATGAPVGPDALLMATERALGELTAEKRR